MARIRTVKPEIWTDEKLTECSLSARLMFIGMLNFADDKGNMAYSAKRLKMQIFPADAIDTQPLLDELIAHGIVIVYSVSAEKFLHIKGFTKHQVINRPSASAIPPYQFDDDSRSTHGALTEGMEGKGKEGKEEKNNESGDSSKADSEKQKEKKAIRLPKDWELTQELKDWTAKERSDLDPDTVLNQFKDYWLAVGGANGRKLDWVMTWRNWVRNTKTPFAGAKRTESGILAGAI